MKKIAFRIAVSAALAACLLWAGSRAKTVRASLSGYQEIMTVSSGAHGSFQAKINPAETELAYELEYAGLEGTVTQSHIHLGARGTNGGIMIWLCGTAGNPGPAGTPVCPQEGKVSRTVGAADVIGPSGQGVAPGEFVEALRALRAGVAYANVHSTMWAGGEIRGQIRDEDGD